MQNVNPLSFLNAADKLFELTLTHGKSIMTYGKKRSAMDQYGKVANQSEVAYASSHRLVQMLMEGALEKIATAKGQITRNDLEGKSRHITWAISIINGLRSSLDMKTGGAIAVNLDDLYSYMGRRLIDANVGNDVEALEEVTQLMLEIKGAWDAMPEEIRNPDGPVVSSHHYG